MLIQALDRNDGNPVEITVQNVDGSGSITTGMGVAMVLAGASINGYAVVKNTAALQPGFVGVASKDIPINGFGEAQVWGLAASVYVSNVGTSITVNAGNAFRPGAQAGGFFSGQATGETLSTLAYRWVTSADTITISGLTWVRGFVRGF
jgi:hypothetical protein